MRPFIPYFRWLAMLCLCVCLLPACNNEAVNVPFPHADSGYAQPVVTPLQFTAPEKITFETVKTGVIRPTMRKLDIDVLPSTPYYSTGFIPLAKTPSAVQIDLKSLKDSAFDLGKIPAKPLKFKTSILPPPVTTRTGLISTKNGVKMSVADLGPLLGLQGSNIFALMEDRDGMIWIGSSKGIYHYDGEYISFYSMHGMSGLFQDNEGKIWFVNEEGIGIIDTRNGLIMNSDQITNPFPRLTRMIQDAKGRIWFSQLSSQGAAVVDLKSMTFQDLGHNEGLSGNYVWSVVEDHKKNIWLATNAGVSIINSEKNRITYLDKSHGLINDTVRNVSCDPNGKIWIAFKNGGLQSLDPETGGSTLYEKVLDISSMTIFRTQFDRQNRLWLATNVGLVIFDYSKGLVDYLDEAQGIPRDFILDMLIDRKGRIWAGTYQSSLLMVEQEGQTTFPIVSKGISSLYQDKAEKLWIGTTNAGIEILDEKGNKNIHLDKQLGFENTIIQSFTEIDGNIWVTSNAGLDIIDQNHKTIEHYGKKEGLLGDVIYTVLKDQQGEIWITGPTDGIQLIDAAKSGIRRLSKAEGLSGNAVTSFKKDRQGRVWVATTTGGVDLIDPVAGTIRHLNNAPGLKDSCSRTLMLDKYDRMWIGTDKGIYIANLKDSTLTSIGTDQGLYNEYISSLIEYQNSVLVGTHHKVNIVTPPLTRNSSSPDGKWKVSVLANSDGLILANAVWDVNTVTKNGKYLWGDAGITIINEIKPQQDTAVTYITGLNLMNQPMNFAFITPAKDKDTIWSGGQFYTKDQPIVNSGYNQLAGLNWEGIEGPYNMPRNLSIPYDLNYVQFQFNQAHIGRRDETDYSYILEGIDKQWSRPDNKTFTDNYLSLPPGNYIFKVRSRFVNDKWSQPATFAFTIRPPWWKTWWAYALYVLTITGIIWGFIHYRSKQLLKENRVLEEKVESRTLEVKQQAEELAVVNQISQALVSQADLNELIHLVGDQLRDLFKADIVYIALLDKKTKIISFPYQYGDKMPPLRLGEGLTSKIILTGQPLLINKDVHAEATSMGVGRVGIPSACYLGVPIPVSDEIIGVLSIQSTETENRFADKDKRLLTTIAATVGVAIRKARLFEEVKKANTEADSARKNAEEANAAKSAFLSTVSHELRTPLTSVLGFAKITKKRLEEKIFPLTDTSDPKTVKTIEQISGNLGVVISEGERLTNLINDVLDLAKIEAGKMEWNLEPVLIPEVIDRAVSATSSLFEQKNLRLEKRVDEGLPEISGDRDKLIQVVVNLLSNAVKFTKEGTVTCSAFMKDGHIVVGITDTGIGIAPGDHAKVFEQFKQVGDTLTDKPKGTGLGLPICKEIVEHHQGSIWLESQLGMGSTFYFSLPVTPKDEKSVRHIQLNDLVSQLKKRMEQSHPVAEDHTATILVVDDDEGIRSLLKQELTEAGYSVDEAANGKEAIEKVRTRRPDLVILDVMMPEMNGFDVAAIMKNDPQTMEIPIIILSVVQDKTRGFRIGVDRYLTKPIDTALLFSEIGHLLEQGKSRKKVMVVDEDNVTLRTLTDVLEAKGYQVVESDGKELVAKAIANQPDIIILNSLISDKHEIVSTLRFEKGLENVLFLIYQ